MPLARGQSLCSYEILGPLGAGGMGEVYRARDTRLEREVAIKVLPEGLADDVERLRRFEREAKTLASLNHPNVAGIHGVDHDGETYFLVLELVPGEDLAARLARGALPVGEAIDVCRQIAEGLEAAHEAGVVHRDLKPANVRITPEGSVKILDFGLAKPIHPKTSRTSGVTSAESDSFLMTEEGLVLGTPTYMSPEQARGKPVDRRTDIWAFGCVLYECLTGERAFGGQSVTDVLGAIIHAEPDWSSLPPRMPARVRELLRRCLAKDPRERLRDIGEARIALSASGSDEPAPPAVGSRRGARLAGALLLALATGAGGWLLRGGGPAADEPGKPVKLRPITFSGVDSNPTASPDGSLIAFVSRRDGRNRIWVKQLVGGGEAALTEGDDSAPRFTPDGSAVLFGRSEQGVSCIYRVGLVGDQTRKLIHDAYEADMSPVDQRLAFLRTRAATSDPESVLVLAHPDGSSERELYVGAYEYLFGVGWSPDGRSLAVSRAPWNNAVEGEVVVIDVDDGSVRVLRGRPAGIMPGRVAWSGAGDALIYAWNPGLRGDMPVSELVRHDVGTGAVTGLAWVSDMAAGLDSAGLDIVAPGTLVFAVESVTQNLAELSLVGGPRNLLTAGQSIDRQPVYSPDGSKVLYSSNRSGNLDLWIVDTATGAVRRLTDDASQDWDPAFTPDGGHVLWSGGRSGNLEVWMARVDGSGARRITQDGVDAQNPTMSVDGEWIAYSTGNPAHPGIHAIRPDGTDDRWLSAQAATLPDVSPDGRHVAFLVPSAGGGQSATLQVADIRSGELVDFSIELAFHPSQVQLGGNYGRMRWLPDGSGIAFIALDEDGDWGVQAQDFVIGRDTSDTRRSLLDTGTEIVESFHISSDGSRAVVSMLRRVGSLMLAEQVPGVEPPRR